MNTDRRSFLAALAGTAALPALNRLARGSSLDHAVSSAGLASDPRRPQYHLLPAANWMNDPNAPIYWRGNYHMFYQYNPNAAVWGDMHWAHAISSDMIHWRHLPVALAPTRGGPDADGCFSGTAVVDGDHVAVLYTGVISAPENEATVRDGIHSFKETQCLAFGSGTYLTTWTKAPQPVIAAPPVGLDVSGFRDPSPWRHGDRWYMVVGSGIRGKHGAVLLYQSTDLRHWEYVHVVASGNGHGADSANPVESGEMWECPELFPLGGKHVLIYSTMGKAFWHVGTLDLKDLIFHSEQQGILDAGLFYAPKTQLDKSGNRILWGWVPESRPVEEYSAAGWAGMMSLPRVLTLGNDGRLRMSVAPETKELRSRAQTLEIRADEEKNQLQIDAMRIESCCGEIVCTVRRTAEPFELSLSDARDTGGTTDVWITMKYDPAFPGRVSIDDHAVLLTQSDHESSSEFHIYIDGSVVEVLVNKQAAYTKRFYYAGNTERNVRLRWTGKTSSIDSLSIWQLSPISTDRLTT